MEMTHTIGSNIVLEINGVYKSFDSSNRTKKNIAVCDVNIRVSKGEFIAIIGKNGSGKTTLLKMIAGIIKPSSGSISIYGNMLAITDLGAGIEPELTGYENIRMIGRLYGIKGQSLDSLIGSVKDFSELGDKLDLPVKHFSQGMYLRLAFSILVFLKVDLIIFDEVLAVGDVSFRKKCIKHISNISKTGSTVIHVTHSFEEIADFCTRCIFIANGQIIMDGDPTEVYKEYINSSSIPLTNTASEQLDVFYVKDDLVNINNIKFKVKESYTNKVCFTENFTIEIGWEKNIEKYGITFTIFILDSFERSVISLSDNYGLDKKEVDQLRIMKKGKYCDSFNFPGYLLNIGDYGIHIVASIFDDEKYYEVVARTATPLGFEILSNPDIEKDFIWKYSQAPVRMATNFSRRFLNN